MKMKLVLTCLFFAILVSMILCTSWASLQQPIYRWQGLTGPDRFWTLATLLDAYCGFLTFYVWVCFKERRWLPRIAWFVMIMLLGNMAMSAYVLLQLIRLRPEQDAFQILSTRNA